MPDPTYPFGATVAETRNLALEITEGVRPTGAPITPARVDDTQVGAWLTAGGGDVAAAIRGYDRLDTQYTTPGDDTTPVTRLGQPDLVVSIVARAKDLTQLYAGSMLATVTYPERSAKAQLGERLYQRFLDGLARLTADVRDELTRLSELSPDDVSAAAAGVGGPDISAPPPFLARRGQVGAYAFGDAYPQRF